MTVQNASRSAGVELDAIHPAVEAAVNRQDLDGLMALYAEDASVVLLDGTLATGADAIREQWAGIIALGATMTLRSRYAVEVGDLAVLSNEWVLQVGDERMSAVSAEVARRHVGGGWLYVIDHPFAGAEPDDIAAIAAATAAVAG
jgi:ketosteroid isomerase-like protein